MNIECRPIAKYLRFHKTKRTLTIHIVSWRDVRRWQQNKPSGILDAFLPLATNILSLRWISSSPPPPLQ